MPTDYYPNLSVSQLENLLERLQRRQSLGTIVQTTAANQTVRKDATGGSRPEVETLRVLYSLYLRTHDSAGVPIPNMKVYSDPYATRIKRTRAFYTYS